MAKTDIFQHAQQTPEGVFLNGFKLEPVVEQCQGCERIKEFAGAQYCTSYPKPAAKWRHGACNFATHIKASVDKQGQVKVNPLKASKRAARRK
ncbi:MAG: PxxKW family cysteine-rich protein [Desulfohalobiaceae bacterium]